MARRWGGPEGGPDGMACAVAFLAWTLCEMGHDVRGYVGAVGPPPWQHPRMEWIGRVPLYAPDAFDADLTISTISASVSWWNTMMSSIRFRNSGRK